MRTQRISLPDLQARCVFPVERSDLAQAISELKLENDHAPVIVLIGGGINEHQADATLRAIQTISRIAEDMHAIVICGGTDMGVMAEIGMLRWQNQQTFPLIGISPEELVTWRGGPRSTKFLWWGTKRWMLAPHYSHFILVPGSKFGDESLWIVDAATLLSKGYRSVTILINGGEVSREDIQLSLETGRPVIALSRTGRLADELARQPNRNKRITIIPANADEWMIEAVRSAISDKAGILLTPSLVSTG
jgi:hypothetical protein